MHKILTSILIGIIILLLFILTDMLCAKSQNVSGKVVDKQYVGSQTLIGNGISSNGSSIVTVQSSPEQFVFIIDFGDKIISATAKSIIFYKIQIGSDIQVRQVIGKFTGICYGSIIVEWEK